MEDWLHDLEQAQWLAQYGHWLILLVFAFSFLEVVIPPIPGDTVLILGSSLAATAGVGPVWLILGASLGTFWASVLCYNLGKRLGEALLDSPRFSKLLEPRLYLRIKQWYSRYGYWTLLMSRLLPVARSGIVVVAGMVEYEKGKSLAAVTLSILISSTVLVMAGYYLGERWREILSLWKPAYFLLLAGLAGLILLCGWLKRQRIRVKEREN